MSEASVNIRLGGVSYAIPTLDIGQAKRALAYLHDGEVEAFPFLQVCLERAKPKAPPMDAMPFDIDEVKLAVKTLTKFCGLAPAPNGGAQ